MLPFLAPGTFKADCAIYQRGASDAAPGEFRRAGVNEASNDNLAAVEDCGNARGEEQRTPEEYPRLCCSTLSLSLGFPLPISIIPVAFSARPLRFSGKLGRGIVGNYVTTTRIMKLAREGEKKYGA